MSRTVSSLLAFAAAVALLVFAAWLDNSVMTDSRRHAAATFDNSGLAGLYVLGSLATAASVLVVGWLGWRSSALVGVLYAVLGGFFVLLPWLMWSFATRVNDVPSVLPEPMASAVSNIYFSTAGPLNAVAAVGAAMLIAGVAGIGRSWRGRVANAGPSTVYITGPGSKSP